MLPLVDLLGRRLSCRRFITLRSFARLTLPASASRANPSNAHVLPLSRLALALLRLDRSRSRNRLRSRLTGLLAAALARPLRALRAAAAASSEPSTVSSDGGFCRIDLRRRRPDWLIWWRHR